MSAAAGGKTELLWRYDGLRACHELVAGDGTVAARIYESQKQKVRLPFRAKSLVSAYYFGERRLAALVRHGREWVTHRRKFENQEERDAYVVRRKDELARFVRTRLGEM